ncbi:aminoglycoside phosphotransferase (APT) family kinase protein [Actinocorallia herbida]|uniref:Aminoglycoside phosphotransferase (APT) family kinase protein n=1 Tax=Actinocorallia herbida TaxID=58109 RepID=A0A3N1D2U6_9ACTN|nr:phosphotransferase family protein [Actinocorallia herbida]ROO87853.1 aminoglycoside phosphotransferase (APT) family kinase protein [Actinocorallia herbida]
MIATAPAGLTERELLAVAAWMDGRGLGSAPLTEVRPLGGGTQNIMVSFRRGERRYVLRRGPRHLRPRSNDAILRETRVLAALTDTPVPHPRLISSCDDPSLLDGAVFYLMDPIEGFNPSLELPAPHAADPSLRRRMAFNIVDALATLGTVDHQAVGLTGFGKPEGFLERQVPRWLAELDSYRRFPGYGGPDIPRLDDVATWLEQRRPSRWQAGILHGDFHCANVMFDRSSTEIAAIVDWEMSTIGDPLLDLGWLLATWRLPQAPTIFGGAFMESAGLPSAAELSTRYAERSSRDIDALTWYIVLACFKLGIVLEGTHARAAAGQAPQRTGEELHAMTLRLFERATHLMDGEQ